MKMVQANLHNFRPLQRQSNKVYFGSDQKPGHQAQLDTCTRLINSLPTG